MGDADKVTILNSTGPRSTPQEPLALVARILDPEQSEAESGGRGGVAAEESGGFTDGADPASDIQKSDIVRAFNTPSFLFVLTSHYLEKCTICSTPTIMKCRRY